MPERNCIHHKDRPAAGLCYQCHKPICKACIYKEAADTGIFCSAECYDRHLAFQSRKQPVIRQGRLKSLVVGLVILAVVAAAAVYIGGGKLGLPGLKSAYRAIFGR